MGNAQRYRVAGRIGVSTAQRGTSIALSVEVLPTEQDERRQWASAQGVGIPGVCGLLLTPVRARGRTRDEAAG